MNPTRNPLEVSPTVLNKSGHVMYAGRSCYTDLSNNITLPTGAQGISLTIRYMLSTLDFRKLHFCDDTEETSYTEEVLYAPKL
jgi:hypothetical protein